jgi:hypothetical protein
MEQDRKNLIQIPIRLLPRDAHSKSRRSFDIRQLPPCCGSESTSGAAESPSPYRPTPQALSAEVKKNQIVCVAQLRNLRISATLQSCLKIATRHPLLPHPRHQSTPRHRTATFVIMRRVNPNFAQAPTTTSRFQHSTAANHGTQGNTTT